MYAKQRVVSLVPDSLLRSRRRVRGPKNFVGISVYSSKRVADPGMLLARHDGPELDTVRFLPHGLMTVPSRIRTKLGRRQPRRRRLPV